MAALVSSLGGRAGGRAAVRRSLAAALSGLSSGGVGVPRPAAPVGRSIGERLVDPLPFWP